MPACQFACKPLTLEPAIIGQGRLSLLLAETGSPDSDLNTTSGSDIGQSRKPPTITELGSIDPRTKPFHGRPMFATLTASDWKGSQAPDHVLERGGRPLREQLAGLLRGQARGGLCPSWCEAFMGFPEGWTVARGDGGSRHSGIQLFLSSPRPLD